MLKIKVYQSKWYWMDKGRVTSGFADYRYCVYLFGILIHEVSIIGLNHEDAIRMFGNKIIEYES